MEESIKIFDTTLRDGAQQVGVSFLKEDKIRIAKALDEMGVHYIEGGWPGSNPKDISFFNEIKSINLKNAKISAFSSTRRVNLDIKNDQNISQLIKAETPVMTIFGKTWDLHVKSALRTTFDENLSMIFDTIKYLKGYCDEVIYDAEHFFDGYKSNKKYAIQTVQAAEASGADCIVLADTNGGTLTGELKNIIQEVKKHISVPIGIHTHNDSDLAVANTLAAVDEGITHVQGTINGIGERCGNANLCSIIPNLTYKMGKRTIKSESIKNLTSISRLVSELSNQSHPVHLPFVGKNAFSHKGGIHVSAVLRNPKMYEHILPESTGNKRMVSVSELSGKSNLLKKAEEMGLEIDNKSDVVLETLKKVKDLESKGYHFEGAEASFELLFKRMLGEVKEYFSIDGYRVLVWKDPGGHNTWAEATIKAKVSKDISDNLGMAENFEHTSADGGGPVEALDKSLRKSLEKFYPGLKSVKLTDYKVRILNENLGTKATTRVLIQSTDGDKKWGTVGVSENIIEASFEALKDSVIYKLLKDEEQKIQREQKSALFINKQSGEDNERKNKNF